MGAAAEDCPGAGPAVADRLGLRGRRRRKRGGRRPGGIADNSGQMAVPVPGSRLEGLVDEPRPGRRGRSPASRSRRWSPGRWTSRRPTATRTGRPGRWPRPAGMSQSAVSRIWRAFGLKPHIVETWKLSTDPQFVTKVRDVVGIYLSPPENALVLASTRSPRSRPWTAPAGTCRWRRPRRPEMTHDYVRHGTTSLFAALDIASGSVIAQHYRRHRHQEFLRFLKVIDAAVPKDLELHLVLDNYATHKTAGQEVAATAPPLPPALHPHLRVLAQPRRTLVRRTDLPQTPPLGPPQRHPTRTGHPRLDQRVEQEPQAVHLDQDRRRHPRHPRRILHTN